MVKHGRTYKHYMVCLILLGFWFHFGLDIFDGVEVAVHNHNKNSSGVFILIDFLSKELTNRPTGELPWPLFMLFHLFNWFSRLNGFWTTEIYVNLSLAGMPFNTKLQCCTIKSLLKNSWPVFFLYSLD